MCVKGTSGGNVPYLRTARVQIAVIWPTTRVGEGAVTAGPPVAVGIAPVPVATGVVRSGGNVKVALAGAVGVSVAGRTGDGGGRVAVSLTGADGSVGRAVRVCATAVLNSE